MGEPLDDFSQHELDLLSYVAQRSAARVDAIANRCAALIASRGKSGATVRTFPSPMRITAEFLGTFFANLARGELRQALELAAAFVERALAPQKHAAQPGGPPAHEPWALVHCLDHAMREEIDWVLAHDEGRRLAAHLNYSRLWLRLGQACATGYSQRREDYLQKRIEEAEEASRSKSATVANMAHEIRTPLNVILGYADLMAERLAELNDGSARFGDPIRRAGQRLLGTISAILDLSRIEAGAYELKPATINLGAMVERHVSDMAVLARNRHIELTVMIDEPNATVRFDERCLSGAIINLLQNAIKFTDSGGVTVRLYRDSFGVLALDVRDTGMGMDAAYLPRLFQPFSREVADPSRRAEGSGLGLALVKRYVELNGARIKVKSEKNAGSVFTISFGGLECSSYFAANPQRKS